MVHVFKENFTNNLVKVCDKSAAGFRCFCDLLTTENDVISEKET